MQKTTLRREQGAGAIHVDRATLENHVWIKNRYPENLGDPRRHDLVEIARRIFATPGIVIPIDNRQPSRRRGIVARQKDRAVIAAPRFVRRNPIKRKALLRQSFQNLARFGFVSAIADVDADWLGIQQRFDHSPQRRQNAIECARKTDPFPARPGKPGGRVRLPFRRHAVAERRRFFFGLSHTRPIRATRCVASSGGNSTEAGELVFPTKYAARFCNARPRAQSKSSAPTMWRSKRRHSLGARSISPWRGDSLVSR